MMMKKKVRGFTLIEMIVVITIIGILSGILVPSLVGYVKKARIATAIADAQTIKTAVESSLMTRFIVNQTGGDISGAFNKTLYLDQNKDKSKREKEAVGAFTNYTWRDYKQKRNGQGKSQIIDTAIAKGIDGAILEEWKPGNGTNPLKYATKEKNCAQYLKAEKTNIGMVIVYNRDFSVRMMQIYRKGILVTYINGQYIANTNKDAHFVGENV